LRHDLRTRPFFITGGAGFIGSTLAERLIDKNRVVLYDNLARNSLQDKPYKDHKNLKLIQGDVVDHDCWRRSSTPGRRPWWEYSPSAT
jgi:UDP-glucose 4-epimerase